MDFILFDD